MGEFGGGQAVAEGAYRLLRVADAARPRPVRVVAGHSGCLPGLQGFARAVV